MASMRDEQMERIEQEHRERRRRQREVLWHRWGNAVGVTCGSGVILVGVFFAIPAFARYQAVLNAQNQVRVNEIMIAQQKQLIEVEQRKASIRVEEAKGIAESQRIIDASLTLNYLQYLAIKAQEKMAGSPSHTQIYIPSGANGIPLVKTVE